MKNGEQDTRAALEASWLRIQEQNGEAEKARATAEKHQTEQRAIAALIAHAESPHGYREYYAALRGAQNTAAGLSVILAREGKRAYDAAARAANEHYTLLAAKMPEVYQRAELARVARFDPRRNSDADRATINNATAAIQAAIEQYRRAGLLNFIEGSMIGVIASLEVGRVTESIYRLFSGEAAGLIDDHYREGLPLETPQAIAARSIWHNTPAAVPVTLLTIQRTQMYYPETDEYGDIICLNPLSEIARRSS
ncbi:Uncharacterised protein [Buttiauxella agrestis]|uniref:Uncharacterized protein n=1 Tax=Buttiauxella agrestis TaxID=82977 RepID=A0A381KNX1_9ENTR|nr:hypothetical protein [Buttiauxella agrestis]SUY93060.1 Uncharacterised protein [Buttiauxella agrestis]